jgi:bifunctional ADP-heptose synthase (sugar kinase/adenylyltransferase)
VTKVQNSDRLITVVESLSDITVTLLADFISGPIGGSAVAIRLAQLGVTVFPVGVVGEDEAGQKILHTLQEHRISTSGISKLKNYATPASAGTELIHGEHPALLNLIEHARKFASASEAFYICDHGIGAASPRALNFIKSNGCLREKTLAARSLGRLADFEQLAVATASEEEIERAIGVSIAGDPKKLEVAGAGIVEEMHIEALLAVSGKSAIAFSGNRKPTSIPLASSAGSHEVDLLGAFFAAALATGAEAEDAANVAARIVDYLKAHAVDGKRLRREELLASLSPKHAGHLR